KERFEGVHRRPASDQLVGRQRDWTEEVQDRDHCQRTGIARRTWRGRLRRRITRILSRRLGKRRQLRPEPATSGRAGPCHADSRRRYSILASVSVETQHAAGLFKLAGPSETSAGRFAALVSDDALFVGVNWDGPAACCVCHIPLDQTAALIQRNLLDFHPII